MRGTPWCPATTILLQGLGRNEFVRIANIKSANKIWTTLADYHEGSKSVKGVRQNQFKKEYSKFEMKPGESVDAIFDRFNKIVSDLQSVDVTYSDSDNARQILNALDMSVWNVLVTTINHSVSMETLTLNDLYSKMKTREIDVLARVNKSNSMGLVTNQADSSSSSSIVPLSALCSFSDEQLEEIPEEQLVLISSRVTKAINNIRTRRRGGPIRCYECSELNHIKMNCQKLRGKEAKDDNTQIRRSQFKIDPSRKHNYRRTVNKILSALDEIDLSDVDSGRDDEDNGKKV